MVTPKMIPQISIALFGVLAIFLVGMKERRQRRWGYLLGLCGQPFWFWVTFQAEQWGIFALAFFYTLSWINGLRNNWRL